MHSVNFISLQHHLWDNEVVRLVAQLHEYKGRQERVMREKALELHRLVELARVQSAEATNEIEGIRISATRLKQLCSNKVTPHNQYESDIMGYCNVLNTIHHYYDSIPIRPNFILQLHRDLFRYSDKEIGGQLKSTQNQVSANVVKRNHISLFTPLSPLETPQALENLCNDLNDALVSGIMDPLLLIPIFIHDFLCIHPFHEGNGRMGRLLSTLLLHQNGYHIGRYISLEHKIAHNKGPYDKAPQRGQKSWHQGKEDATPFIIYWLRILMTAYQDLDERLQFISSKHNATDMVRKAVLSRPGSFTKTDLMALCPSIGKSSVENALKQLLEERLILRHGGGRSTFYMLKLHSHLIAKDLS